MKRGLRNDLDAGPVQWGEGRTPTPPVECQAAVLLPSRERPWVNSRQKALCNSSLFSFFVKQLIIPERPRSLD